jgi:hypothetical protein
MYCVEFVNYFTYLPHIYIYIYIYMYILNLVLKVSHLLKRYCHCVRHCVSCHHICLYFYHLHSPSYTSDPSSFLRLWHGRSVGSHNLFRSAEAVCAHMSAIVLLLDNRVSLTNVSLFRINDSRSKIVLCGILDVGLRERMWRFAVKICWCCCLCVLFS